MWWSEVEEKDRTRTGEGVIVIQNKIADIMKVQSISERVIAAQITLEKRIYLTITAYAPNRDANEDEKNEFYKEQ